MDLVKSIPHFDRDVIANIEKDLGILQIADLRLNEVEEEKKGGDQRPAINVMQNPISMEQHNIKQHPMALPSITVNKGELRNEKREDYVK